MIDTDQVAPIRQRLSIRQTVLQRAGPQIAVYFLMVLGPGVVASSGADVWGPATSCSPQTNLRLGSPVRFVVYRDIVDY